MDSGGRIGFSESRKVAWALGGGHRPALVSYLPEDGDNRERNKARCNANREGP